MISTENIASLARARVDQALAQHPAGRFGRIISTSGEILLASGIRAPIGARCRIEAADNTMRAAEVIGFEAGAALLMPEQSARGIMRGARIQAEDQAEAPLVGGELLGRVIDARGAPLDGLGTPELTTAWPLLGTQVNPLSRARIAEVFDCGVAAVNALATLGWGMRVGLFAGSGVGKTTLLGMMARYAMADVVVVGMIGERGREIREFIEDQLGEARARAVVVAAPADATALSRLHGAYRAAAIAEFFRAQGANVLLLVDSLTRMAMALREIGLATGEPPASKGYPPSVFSALAAYIERAGNGGPGQGSITALYTVLVEGDDLIADPIADAARAALDGHIVLARAQAEAGIFPPVDVLASLSRPMQGLVAPDHAAAAARFRGLWARRAEKQDFIDLGAYAPGRDPLLDEALRLAPAMEALLRQDRLAAVPYGPSVQQLNTIFGERA